jgi:hypothetical protein
MLLGIRDTAAMPPFDEALPGGANWNVCHELPSYQLASFTEPSAPIHQTSMLLGIRDTAAMFFTFGIFHPLLQIQIVGALPNVGNGFVITFATGLVTLAADALAATCAGGLVIFAACSLTAWIADIGTLKPFLEAVPLGRRVIDIDFSIVSFSFVSGLAIGSAAGLVIWN